MWGRVHDEPEVFALLAGVEDLLASQGCLEGAGGCADFAVDDLGMLDGVGGEEMGQWAYIIFLSFNSCYGLSDGVFLEVVDDARDFGDLWVVRDASVATRGSLEARTSGMMRSLVGLFLVAKR